MGVWRNNCWTRARPLATAEECRQSSLSAAWLRLARRVSLVIILSHARATRLRGQDRALTPEWDSRSDRPEPCDKRRYRQQPRPATPDGPRVLFNGRQRVDVNCQQPCPPKMMDSDWYASLVPPSTPASSEKPASHRRRASLLQQPNVSCSCNMPWYVGRTLG